MIFPLLLATTLTLYSMITFRSRHWGLLCLFALLPSYVVRFSVGPLPMTLLEAMLLLFFFITLICDGPHIWQQRQAVWQRVKEEKLLLSVLGIFFLSAIIGLFTATDVRTAAGEWKAFFLEPMALFVLLFVFLFQTAEDKKKTLKQISVALVLSGFITSLLAIYQKFTGFYVPHAFWANGESYRVTAWYGFPNGVGLFLAPLIPLAVYVLVEEGKKLRRKKELPSRRTMLLCALATLSIPSMTLAILFAKSTGGLVAVAGSLGLLLLYWKKTRKLTIIASIIATIGFLLLPTQHPIKQELLLQDFSGQIRLQMWQDTAQFLQNHWLLGAGLGAYQERMQYYHSPVNGRVIEQYHHPHNLFLAIWVNTGLTGLLSFVILLSLLFYRLFNALLQKDLSAQQGFFFLALCTILISGLVDSPYVKNDLAVLFWGIVWGSISVSKES